MMKKKPMEENAVFTLQDYGRVRVHVDEMRVSCGLSKNRLVILTGVSYNVVKRYCQPEVGGMVDLDFLAKACYVLGCGIGDLLTLER